MRATRAPCSTICPLCDQLPENAVHLALQCPFSKLFWFMVGTSLGMGDFFAEASQFQHNFQDWWNGVLIRIKNKKQRRSVAAVIMYTIWNIWKE
ncbi:hypothetical protein SETIT_5G449700v2 [Setaria italica]|uniref:Reverse transcriptase zinc-binding domain-containing protein n=1 Tax=Setaria italica TaxID=4555 RepID=A0A368RHI1_SETIT|nr:hypothetical protein SETIT_5G449700v2 [Setaria italica]